MVLPLDRFSRSPIVEFAVPLTPVEQVTSERDFRCTWLVMRMDEIFCLEFQITATARL
jgi:hypothetical protein